MYPSRVTPMGIRMNARMAAAASLTLAAAAPLLAQTAPGKAKPEPVVVAEVAVRNDAPFARRETVEVLLKDLPGLSKPADLERIHVTLLAGGGEILSQGMDTNGDYDDDTLVFQADVAPKATAKFRLSLGEARSYRREDFRVYGRFVRERFDDFAWENDKVAFRMYGEALETWEREPLTSSSVDAWVKKTPRLTVNDWYLIDDYHKDHGEGGDFYSAGKTRGCGGSGLMSDGRLFTSRNFRKSRVLSRGPIRLLFELTYDAWDVAGVKVRETKRVTLDAGSHFSRFESRYSTEGGAPLPEAFLWAAGTKKEKGADIRIDPALGLVRAWEKLNRYGEDGFMGCAVVADPKAVVSTPELDGNVLLALRGPAAYYAGTGWDRGGEFKGMADFDAHADAFARRLATPLAVEVLKR
ncbi:MAG: DUF4861 domain-containing protein [Vicinamibacteria bacterium]|nr:DUF4861 domain-containing protein [Vicinamibacteria bacterium]